MGRIEDALAKLHARHAATSGKTAGPQPMVPMGRVLESRMKLERPTHAYSGRHIEVDFDVLRKHGLLAPGSRERTLAEEYRVIKRPLLNNAGRASEPLGVRQNVLMVASALAGEGKTFTCINLCLSIAHEQDWSVVLVDGDCAKPQLTQLFGAENEPGLLDLLTESPTRFEDCVMPTNIPGLSVLPAGRRQERSSELLTSDRMSAICDSISRADSRRMIIFDSPPLLLTSQALALSAQAGQIVLVVKANKTPQRAVLSARDMLSPTKAVMLLLNQVPPSYRGSSSYGHYGEPYVHGS